MKKFLTAIALVSCFTACFSACKKDVKNITDVQLMNGYESYKDLEKTMMQGNRLFGRATLCQEQAYVTQGNSCMKLEVDMNAEFASPYQSFNVFEYVAEDYGSQFTWLDTMKEIKLDIYNAEDREYTLYVSAEGEQNDVYFCDGAELVANSLNTVTIPIKPWFFEKDTAVKKFCFYIDGIQNTEDKLATFYIDNVRIGFNSQAKMPDIEQADGEILSFSKVKHIDAVSTTRNPSSSEFLPFVRASQNPNLQIGKEKGVLEVSYGHTYAWGNWYIENDGYDIWVHKSILECVSSVKTLSVVCKNPESETRTVSLIAKSGSKTYEQKTDVTAKSTTSITLDFGKNVETVDELYIRIYGWNVVDTNVLYFADLQYTV